MQILKKLRTDKGVYQKEVAAYLGIDRTTYVKYERGDTEPNIDMLQKLAEYFDVSIDYLLGRDTESKKIHPSETDERISKLASQYKEAGQLFDIFPQLSADQQKTILDLAQVYIAQQDAGSKE